LVVLLDEPSSGMDPGAWRMMWDAIVRATQHYSSSGSSSGSGGAEPVGLLLTTHYIDEAEALCERLAIMDKGRLVCLGSSQHL
jgi:ABC-type multidrug transport system ATPase subunit